MKRSPLSIQSTRRSASIATWLSLCAAAVWVPSAARATDYTWSSANTANWNNGAAWTTAPTDDNTFPSTTADNIIGNSSAAVATANGNYTVGDITTTTTGWTIQGDSAATASSVSFDELVLNATFAFRGNAGAGAGGFSVSGRLVTYNAGGVSFGTATGVGNRLAALTLSEGLTYNNTASVNTTFNVGSDYNLGLISSTSSGTKNISLTQSSEGGSRQVSVSGLATSGGTVNIRTGTLASTSDQAVTLRINNAQNYATNAVLANLATGGNTGNTLAVLKVGVGTQTFSGASTYSGGTSINAGILAITAGGKLGTGNVSVLATAVSLTINAGVTNAVDDAATLSLAGGGTVGVADVGFAVLGDGVTEQVGGLILGGINQLTLNGAGTYGSTASAATFKNDEYFSGTGVIRLQAVPEPGTWLTLLGGLGLLAGVRWMRRCSVVA